jgi:hypothetical protein
MSQALKRTGSTRMRGVSVPFGAALLALAASLAVAQSGEDPAPAPSPSAQAETSGTGENAAPADANSESRGDGVVLSPFDYEASESISEDASVSFPVDI